MLTYKNENKKNSFEIKVHKLIDNPNQPKKQNFTETITSRIESYYSLLDNVNNKKYQTHK